MLRTSEGNGRWVTRVGYSGNSSQGRTFEGMDMDTSAEKPSQTPAGDRRTEAGPSRWQVVLVESDPHEAACVSDLLGGIESPFFSLEWADSLEAVIKRLAAGGIDLVLLPMTLRDAGGLGALSEIKAAFPSVAVVLLTDRECEPQENEMRERGALACVPKERLDAHWLALICRCEREHALAEEKLRSSLSFYRSVAEQLPHGIFRKDLHGRFTYVNPAFSELAGLPQHELVGRTSHEAFPKELADDYHAHDLEALKRGTKVEQIKEFQSPDGQRLYLHISKTPVRNQQGRIIALQGLMVDVTDRQQAVEAARASQHLLESILANSPAVIVAKDLVGRYLLSNRRFESLVAQSREQVLGRTDMDLFPPEVADRLRANDLKVAQTGASIECEVSLPAGGGTRDYIMALFPLRDASGRTYAVCSIGADITERQQIQAALDRERFLLTTLISNLPDPVYFKDTASRFIRVNPALAERLGGADPEQMIGKTDFDFFAPEHAGPAFVDEKEVMKTGQPIIGKEEKEVWPDGAVKWVSTTKMPLRNEAGQIIGTFGVSRDITERKQAELRLFTHYIVTRALAEATSLRESAPRFLQAICESVDWDYGEIWLFDRPANLLRCFGLWHRPTLELRRFGLAVQECSFAPGCDLAGRVWSSGKPAWVEDTSRETDLPRAAMLDQAGLHGALGFPIHFSTKPLGVLTFFSRQMREPDADVMEMLTAISSLLGQFIVRKRAEEARSRLGAIVESSEDAIFSENLDGIVTSWNPGAARMFGYEREEVLGQPASRLVPPECAEEMARLKSKIEHLEPVQHFETSRLSKKGRSIPVSLTLSPIKDAQGSVVGLSSIARNISDRKRAEDKLRAFAASLAQSNRDLMDFAFVASHDLQEPLGKVHAFADLLEGECQASLSEKGRDYLRRLRRSVQRMEALVRGLLAFSRVQTDAQPFEPVDLNEVLSEVMGDLENRIQETRAQVDAGSLGMVEGDAAQLRQLLQNLIGNALKFARKDVPPVIRLEAQRVWERISGPGLPREVCRLTIQDNGIGIEEKYLNRIFNMFQRLKPHEYEGAGIGLAVCRRIAQRHEGDITVRSTVGQGTTFIVTLPVRQRRGDTSL